MVMCLCFSIYFSNLHKVVISLIQTDLHGGF